MSAPAHLSAETIAGYCARTLGEHELLSTVRHLAECCECQNRIAPPDAPRQLLDALAGEAHLDYEEIEAIVLGGAVGLDHVAHCRMCAAELEDLRRFRASLIREAPPRVRWRIPVLIPAALAAGMLLTVMLRENPPAMVKPLATAALDPESAKILRSGTLRVYADPELVRSRELLMGDVAEVPLSPSAPVGEVILSDRPAFQWAAPNNAKSFRVEVFNNNFEPVLSSGIVAGETWVADKPLTRGEVYTWTVSAVIGGLRTTAPRPPQPEAKFRVASSAAAEQMNAALQAQPPSELRIAAVAAQLGFREAARQALARYAEENPSAPLINILP